MRLSSTPTGTAYAARAYTPYGAPYDESGGYADRSFTGAQQDIASSKDDFLYREYEPVMGRWFTPDPAGLAAVDPNHPQTWNRYAYVGGNPLGAVDPTGLLTHCPVDPVSGEPACPDPAPFSTGAGPGSHSTPAPEQSSQDPGSGGESSIGPPTKPTGLKVQKCESANNFVQRIGIATLGFFARLTGATIGLGVSGSFGSGLGIGAWFGASRQVVVSPSRRAAFVTTYNFALTPAGVIFGSGVLGGIQLSVSGAIDPEQLNGISADFSIQGAEGFGGGLDLSAGSVFRGAATLGIGAGGFGAGLLPQITSVVPICGHP